MVESKYEEVRRKRLEENKKRMEELNLIKLSNDLHSPSPKPSPAKKMKRVERSQAELIPVRRSTRVADKPPVSYKEVAVQPFERPRRVYSYQRRNLLNRVYASDEERTYAIDRAEQLQSELEADFPSFVKPMLQSHVTGGFWLGLPVQFCKTNLPHQDEIITLEDENGETFETKYLADKTGLSGGWRGFAIDHGLVDGDALVFQLVTATSFKVYIIRVYESDDKGNQEDDNENGVEIKGNQEDDHDNENGVEIKGNQEDDNENGVEITAPDTIARRVRARRSRRYDKEPNLALEL